MDLRTNPDRRGEPAWSPLLWLLPAALLLSLAVLGSQRDSGMPQEVAEPPVGAGVPGLTPPLPAAGVDAAGIDWSRVPAEPEPVAQAVAAYDS